MMQEEEQKNQTAADQSIGYQQQPTVEATKQETEVDLPNDEELEEQKGQEEQKRAPMSKTTRLQQRLQQARRDAANVSQLRQANASVVSQSAADRHAGQVQTEDDEEHQKQAQQALGIPVDLQYSESEGKFQVHEGRVKGKLYEFDQKGRFSSLQLQSAYYRCDTVKKEFGTMSDKKEIVNMKLISMFQVDDRLAIPQRHEFIINGTEVKLIDKYNHPFAILNAGQVHVFWAASEAQRNYWVRALRALQGSKAGQLGDEIMEQNQIVTTKENFFVAQAYMFMKREYQFQNQINTRQQSQQMGPGIQDDQDGEGGGGEPAGNDEEEEAEIKQFSMRTVYNDANVIKGFLYKTAQSIGFLQRDFFIRRYYVLDKQSKVLTIHTKPEGKAQHTLQLSETLLKVHTGLNTFLKPDFMKNFKDDVRNLELPKDNPLPFALYVNNQVAILWAATDADYDLWIEAFQAIQSFPTETTEVPVVEQNRKNRFVTSLLAALTNEENNQKKSRPRVHSVDIRRVPTKKNSKVVSYQSKTLIVMDNKVEGQLLKTAQQLTMGIRGRQKNHLYLRHYCLDLTSKTLFIYRVGKSSPDLTVNLYLEGSKVVQVDTNLTHHKVRNYMNFFKTPVHRNIVTGGEFKFPMAVRLQQNQIMLLWTASDFERNLWAQAFKDTMAPRDADQVKEEVAKLIVTDENEFVATLYKCLVPVYGPDGKPLPKTDYRIRIEQEGQMLKTSQRWAAFMRGKKYYHMRLFKFNIATGLLQQFSFEGEKKNEKPALDLRNKVIHVKRLGQTLRTDYLDVFKKHCEHTIERVKQPHDYKFPFYIVYLGKKDQLEVMLFWAETEKSRSDWIDAFEYVKADFAVPAGKTIDDLVVPLTHNEFVVAFSKALSDYDPDAKEQDLSKSTSQNELQESNEEVKTAEVSPTPAQAPAKKKQMSDSELIEEYWERFKTETPPENFITGNGTFQIQPKCSMGLIRARKELFDNNYDPGTIVSCFLVIDFDSSLIGIRSVDTGFSAMICLKTTDLIEIQGNEFASAQHHEQVSDDGSECLTNTIELILACKRILIAPHLPSHRSLIVNELNRAKIIQDMSHSSSTGGILEFQKASSAASNQQMHAGAMNQEQDRQESEVEQQPIQARSYDAAKQKVEEDAAPRIRHHAQIQNRQANDKRAAEPKLEGSQLEQAKNSKQVQQNGFFGGLQAYDGPTEGEDEDDGEDGTGRSGAEDDQNNDEPAQVAQPMFTQAGKRQWSSVRQQKKQKQAQLNGERRVGRFDEQISVAGLGTGYMPIIKDVKKRVRRDQYAEDGSDKDGQKVQKASQGSELQDSQFQSEQHANNQQDFPENENQAEQVKPKVIPLNKIKFTGLQVAGGNQSAAAEQENGAGRAIRKNSLFTEEESGTDDNIARRQNLMINIHNVRASNNEEEGDASFLSSVRGLSIRNVRPQSSSKEPIVLKIRKKKQADSRASLQNSFHPSQSINQCKIDFHATYSFQNAFPQSAGLGGTRPFKGGPVNILNQTTQVDYEKKIQECRDESFIEKLVMQNEQKKSNVGNRFMSPAVRLAASTSNQDALSLSRTQPIKDPLNSPKQQLIQQNPNQDNLDDFTREVERNQQQQQYPLEQSQPAGQPYERAVEINDTNTTDAPVSNRQVRNQLSLDVPSTQNDGAASQAQEKTDQAKADGELSDWDEDSDDGSKPAGKSAFSSTQPLYNIRDPLHSNVFHGIASPTAGRKPGTSNMYFQNNQR